MDGQSLLVQEQALQQSLQQQQDVVVIGRSDRDVQEAHAYVAAAQKQLPGKYRFYACAGKDVCDVYPTDAAEADADAQQGQAPNPILGLFSVCRQEGPKKLPAAAAQQLKDRGKQVRALGAACFMGQMPA